MPRLCLASPDDQSHGCSGLQVTHAGDLVITLPIVIFSITTNIISEIFQDFVRCILKNTTDFKTVKSVFFFLRDVCCDFVADAFMYLFNICKLCLS